MWKTFILAQGMVWKTVGTEAMKSTKYISKLIEQTKSEKIYKEMNAGRGTESLKIVHKVGFEMCWWNWAYGKVK